MAQESQSTKVVPCTRDTRHPNATSGIKLASTGRPKDMAAAIGPATKLALRPTSSLTPHQRSERMTRPDITTPTEEITSKRNWRKRRFQEWLALPSSMRPEECRTEIQFAALLRVNRQTLRRWKHEEGFWDAVYPLAKAIIGDQVADILQSMADEAVDGSVNAAKLCLQVLGITVTKPDTQINVSQPLTVVLTSSN